VTLRMANAGAERSGRNRIRRPARQSSTASSREFNARNRNARSEPRALAKAGSFGVHDGENSCFRLPDKQRILFPPSAPGTTLSSPLRRVFSSPGRPQIFGWLIDPSPGRAAHRRVSCHRVKNTQASGRGAFASSVRTVNDGPCRCDIRDANAVVQHMRHLPAVRTPGEGRGDVPGVASDCSGRPPFGGYRP